MHPKQKIKTDLSVDLLKYLVGYSSEKGVLGGSVASLVAQSVKSLPARQETWVPFLGQKDPLEKEMATHSSILAWRTPQTEEPGRQSTGLDSLWGCQSQTRLSIGSSSSCTWVPSLGGEDALEKGTATHSSVLAWEIRWTGEPGRPQSRGSQKSWTRLSD